ncbi:MAG: putative Ig domain-containing protein, partial [Thermoanaerobaculia bacterium]
MTRLQTSIRFAAMTLAAVLFAGAAHAACSINIGPASLPDATLNQNYSQLLSASGAITPFTFVISSGALPPGLRLQIDRILGIPTSVGSNSFQISVTDSTNCQATKSFGLKVIDPNTSTCPAIVIGPTTLPAGVVGMAYNQRMTFGGGTAPYSLTFGQGSIPPGIGLLGTTLAGTPTLAGVFGFDLIATDSKGCRATQHYDFQILGQNCPTDVATVLAPANGSSQDAAKPILFAWTAVAGAASYDILASTDNGATYNVVASTSNGTTTSASATLVAGDYVASVRTAFSAACSTRSATVRFTVSGNSACTNAPPTLIAPKPAAVNTSPSVTFQWSAVPNAIEYKLFTSVNGALFEDVAETSSTTATVIVSTGTIDWYVEARFANCASVRSATARFVVGALPCGTGSVTLVAPANGATTSSPTTFAWTGITGASAYRVWLGIDNATPSIIARVTTTSASLQVPSGAAEWFVEAQFDNCPSIFSAHGRFTIARAASCANNLATTLLSPLSGDTSASVTFKWNTVPGAIAYRLWVAATGQAFSDAGLTPLTQLELDLAPGSYSWYVDTIFAGCPAISSSTATFRVPDTGSNCRGDAPTIIAPANGAVATSPVTFTWTSVANATEYRVYASVNGGALELVDDTKDMSLTESFPDGTIVWLVEATFKGCPATRSGISRFTVPRAVTCPSDEPEIISPSNGSEVISPVTLSWSAVTGAVRYVVVARTSSGAQTAIGETALTQLQRDLPAGTIEWFVIALGAGCPPIDSDRGKFTVASPAGC